MSEVPDESKVKELEGRFEGEIIRPEDPNYAEARKVFNSMIDKSPALIARPTTDTDVQAAVDLARESDLPVAVRCGGHSVAGKGVSEGGVLIDLKLMKGVEIDAEAKTARAGGGVLWGEFDAATQAQGLHAPGGRVTTTGVGGFTLGGGYGWTSSKYGLACDNLIGATVVTADGDLRKASEEENEDLFWGIRGASGNFGVVTSYEFQLQPLGPIVLAGLALWPVAKAGEVLRAWRDCVEEAPNELSTACVILTGPPEEFVPEHLQGQAALAMAAMYVGDPDEGKDVVQPLKDLGPDLDLIQPMPYTEFQTMLDPGNPPGFRNYWRGEYMAGLPDEAIDTFVERASKPLSPLNQMALFRFGGAVREVSDDATAFSHREAEYLFHPICMWEDPADDERMISWNREFAEAMQPFTTDAVYLNFTTEDDEDAVRAGYGEKYERLVALKDKYDPENLFQHNQNIKPSREAGAPAAA